MRTWVRISAIVGSHCECELFTRGPCSYTPSCVGFITAIEFERYLQSLESENRQFEMGLAMRKASLEKTKDEQCSLDAIK